ncbi:winged helix-turn-helix transcriptional regulator [Pseudomonas aeruginosa]|nr:winged helix-turn-helix transcriptional regulator [Pseudomonas aeruginosa]
MTDERYGYIHASMLPTQCLCTKLRRAARSVSRFYDEALADTGLKVAQFSLLRHVRRLDRPSISELAEAMGLDRSTLGRNLRVLEGDGLLRLTGGEDQRNRLVELTPAGLDALERGTPAWEDAQRRLAGRLGEERSGALAALLAELERLD